MIVTYPVIFTETNDNKETVLIEVPDIEAMSEGFGMDDAIFMAKDLIYETLCDMRDDGEEFPEPSDPDYMDISEYRFFTEGESQIMVVAVDVGD
jgi:predicted RNase H-like HicB family nuclease